MDHKQFETVIAYLDTEYAGILGKLTPEEKKKRVNHWADEIGGLDYNAVMTAVRKLARNAYMPRTAEVIAEVESQAPVKTTQGIRCRIFRDATGQEILDLRHSDGSEWMYGYLSNFPDWMQLKFRWQANPTPENTLAWDNYILQQEMAR